jgi:hypothetical protein
MFHNTRENGMKDEKSHEKTFQCEKCGRKEKKNFQKNK